eukprot:TRINITY_DN3263_c0_g1_i2.p3 TRINITY_DN3263_c0_g1~~TRINITY_DN3263_c0_g1_i2.p3  ORF type:complete len:132 (+),score=5.73 TRINITY_DN3263_c0_g1_i2:1454-1849(+)
MELDKNQSLNYTYFPQKTRREIFPKKTSQNIFFGKHFTAHTVQKCFFFSNKHNVKCIQHKQCPTSFYKKSCNEREKNQSLKLIFRRIFFNKCGKNPLQQAFQNFSIIFGKCSKTFFFISDKYNVKCIQHKQ